MDAEFDAFWRAKNICVRFSFPKKLLFVLKLKQTHSAFAYNNAEILKEFEKIRRTNIMRTYTIPVYRTYRSEITIDAENIKGFFKSVAVSMEKFK